MHNIVYLFLLINSVVFAQVSASTSQDVTISPTEIDFEIEVPIDYGICENWTLAIEATTGECSWKSWKNGQTLQCFGGLNNLYNLSLHNELMMQTDELVLCGWPNSTFDPRILKHFPNIKILRIEHSNLTHIHNDFPELKYLQNINISWSRLGYTRPTLFKNLPTLKYVDLRWNRLNHMHGPLIISDLFENLQLAGNPWNCSHSIKWILYEKYNKFISDRHFMLCSNSPYIGRPVITVMEYKKKLAKECHDNSDLRNCTCLLYYLRPIDEGHALAPMYSINCSHVQLFNLPARVPENTTIFYAMGNQISNIELLKTAYKNVHDVYLDYNQIKNIETMESDRWLQSFRVFSLKGNKLTKLPVYVLDNALKRNHQVAKLYLSNNPWRCECIFTLRFQELLRKYHSIIVDSSNVTCKYIDDENNIGNSVLNLKRSDVCNMPTESQIQPLNLLNAVLASLIILILGKLAYDYYYYRKMGRLPWIVTKMP